MNKKHIFEKIGEVVQFVGISNLKSEGETVVAFRQTNGVAIVVAEECWGCYELMHSAMPIVISEEDAEEVLKALEVDLIETLPHSEWSHDEEELLCPECLEKYNG